MPIDETQKVKEKLEKSVSRVAEMLRFASKKGEEIKKKEYDKSKTKKE